MYKAYWQLHTRPFESCTDARFYYPAEAHQGALLKLRYAVESQLGAALLCGTAGSGKTLLVQGLRRQLDERFRPFVHLVFPKLTGPELVLYLAAELGVAGGSHTSASVAESVRGLQNFLRDNSDRGSHAVIAIDEAHLLLDTDTLETLRLLMNFEGTDKPSHTLLLVGHPQLLAALERMQALEARLGVKCLLRSLSLEETISYINHRLTAAGATQEIFTTEAITALHELTAGNPRRINRLCDLALLIGYAEEQVRINAHQIESVCNELVTIAPE
ncbi:MAG TPA: AAA family ATPase [Pirellulales bacterium]|nr:AAA family ATPase [Pirellulales bacterium]